ncbi:hypothetical protein V8E36_004141 [Tilletia maclaganii]
MTSFDDGSLVLYDLTTKRGGRVEFSPHCVKALVDFKILGVKYEPRRLSFVQVRTELAKKVKEDVTVPTLELKDGTHVVDSFEIASWLEKQHPEGHKLFSGSDEGKRLASFINNYAQIILRPSIGGVCVTQVAQLLDEESYKYFTTEKFSPELFAKYQSTTPEQRKAHVDEAVKNLGPIEALLTVSPSHLSKHPTRDSPWLAGGAEPSHADACLFG